MAALLATPTLPNTAIIASCGVGTVETDIAMAARCAQAVQLWLVASNKGPYSDSSCRNKYPSDVRLINCSERRGVVPGPGCFWNNELI